MSDTTEMTTALPVLMDTRQVAAYLNCSELTVEKLRKSGRLPYVVVCDRLIRFLPADLESYLQSQRRVAP